MPPDDLSPEEPIDPPTPASPGPPTFSRRLLIAGAMAGGVSLLAHGARAATPDAEATPVVAASPAAVAPGQRIVRLLDDGWTFFQDDALTDAAALRTSGATWTTVTLPHTWNAEDAASLDATGYKRGLGWYKLAFATPAAGARHWLEIGAASLVADVWLNGSHLGQHRGGFTAFRFDITDHLARDGRNELLVKCDNRPAAAEGDPTAIEPLNGDFNISGGLYRYVALVSTASPVHIALDDMGGPGVYATTVSIDSGVATVNVEARLSSDGAPAGTYAVRLALRNERGEAAASTDVQVSLATRDRQDVAATLAVANAHLWQGTVDPFLYQLVAEVRDGTGAVVDTVAQPFGIRLIRFDVDRGFFLNDTRFRLRGVAMHQDFLGRAWATTEEDWDTSFSLIHEMGANALRMGHYPFPRYALDRADALGLVVLAEKPNGQKTTIHPCTATLVPPAFVENAELQLQEMIRQQSNHASVATWSVGNEAIAGLLSCETKHDTVRPYIRRLNARSKELDPSRPTIYSAYPRPVHDLEVFTIEGITDLYGTNRYYLWYFADIQDFGPTLDAMHIETLPHTPLAVTEYGIGAAITHHTDNPRGGYPDYINPPAGEVAWQPEEYAGWAHEQNHAVVAGKDFLWASFIWNMFDFGSAGRREGDVLGVNTKGLVTFDRQTRKDPFYFYKAVWTDTPTTYIVGHRYTDRAYAVNDIRVYSNAESMQLSLNGQVVGTLPASASIPGVFVFPGVRLRPGTNTIAAVGTHGGATSRDEAVWTLASEDVNIAAGLLPTGFMSSDGHRFGSDTYFTGGTFATVGLSEIGNTPDPHLYKHVRQGSFRYDIPVADGTYRVTLGFIEPDAKIAAGGRVFTVTANGRAVLDEFDVRQVAGAAGRVVTREFMVDVAGGMLELGFTPSVGDAIVSTIMVHRVQ